MSGLVEPDTLGSGCMVTDTVMEYTIIQVEVYIQDNKNKIKEKVMHIGVGQMEVSIMDSGRMIICTERELDNRKAYYTQFNMIMIR